jgi:DNA-binding transcriptional regulator YiaG
MLGTPAQNSADMAAKGRQRTGTINRSGLPKLNPRAAEAIRMAYPTVSQPELARRYGVSVRAVQLVLAGVTWKVG